jgi:hypothetical protein
MPTFTWVSMKAALADASTMSESTTKCSPPPTQRPFTAQITGFHTRFCWGDQCTASARGASTKTASASSPSASATSKPVQKCRSPVAVTIATRTRSSSRTWDQIARKTGCMPGARELPRSGRSRVMTAMPSSRRS